MNNIQVIDGINVQTKSPSTTSIDVHLNSHSHHTNIILPDGTIIVVDLGGISVYDHTETLINQLELV